MPLLEEVGEGSEEANCGAEDLKAEHRRKRAKKTNSKSRKKKVEGESVSFSVFGVLALAAVVVGVGFRSRAAALLRESNKCKMTMSRPEYVHLPVERYPIGGGDAADEIPGYQYRLMRYMDRKLPASDRQDPRKPGGVPVLFVPGHLGSYEQARSLGSRASETKIATPRRRLDIFTLDLLGEWTALHGSLVWRQADFLNHAVEAILALYEGGDGPPSVTSVMIVGHSLGGLVARTAFTLPSYRVGSITDLVTLGTPHDQAPWMMDYSVVGLYRCVDSLWRWHSPHPSTSAFSHCWPPAQPTMETAQPPHPTLTHGDDDSAELGAPIQEASPLGGVDMRRGACVAGDGGLDSSSEDCAVDDENPQTEASVSPVAGWGQAPGVDGETLLGNTVLLSLSGGPKDMMVHPSLCEVDGLGLEGQSLGFTTAAVDECGFGVDHLALVWCKQLVGRVVATLSELEKLHTAGAGTRERTRVAAGILSSSQRSSKTDASSGGSGNYGSQQLPQSAGFQEAADAGAEWILVARSLVTDRSYLIIPAWVCLASLALAAALTKGLSSKKGKERGLPPVLHLLTPEILLQWQPVKFALRSLWGSGRSQEKAAIVAVATSCAVIAAWTFGGNVAGYFPDATGRVQDAVESIPGISAVLMVGTTVLRVVGGMVGGVAQTLNPLEGAVDTFRLPNKAIAAVYFVSTGWMMLFLLFVSVLGAVGNGACWLLGLNPWRLAAYSRALRSRSVVVFAGCAVILFAHVEKFSLPPTFRAITVTGEVSMVFMTLSLSLYLLLASLALFPASLPTTLAHQRLVLLLYAPAPAVLMGPQLAAAGVIFGRAGPHEPFVSVGEFVLASLSLLPIIASVWFARRARPFPSPPSIRGFLAEFRAQMEEEVARANGGSIGREANGRHGASGSSAGDLAAAALENPHGHGACGRCLHEDGGHGAVFVETEHELVSVGVGVTLGPGFRVVACDCPQRERAAPSTWCEFCRCVCDVCGGCKDAARLMRGARMPRGANSARGEEARLSDELGAGGAVGVLSVAVLYVGLWAFGMRVMGTPCHSLLAMAVMGGILCGMRWGVVKDAKKGFRAS